MSSRQVIVQLAYACEPESASEPYVGWQTAIAAASFADVHVITRQNNRPHIEDYEATHGETGIDFSYYDLPPLFMVVKSKQRFVHLYYVLWQWGVRGLLHRTIRDSGASVVHHVTFVNYWLPSAARFAGVPVVLGPIGGGDASPHGSLWSLGLRGAAYELLRGATIRLMEMSPAVRRTITCASTCVAATPATAKRLSGLGAQRTIVHSQLVMAGEVAPVLRDRSTRKGCTFLSVGRLLPFKGCRYALQAFARAAGPQDKMVFVGDGPERRHLLRLAGSLGVEEKVILAGPVSRGQVDEYLKAADVLVHLSLHESGGMVCLEALANGLPVICVDSGGPGMIVTPECGRVLKWGGTAASLIADASAAMRELASDAQTRELLGAAGISRVERAFTEAHYSEWLRSLYSDTSCAS